MPDPKRVIVMGGGVGLCDRLRYADAEITLVDTPARYDSSLIRTVCRTVLTEFDDPSLLTLLKSVHDAVPFSAVLSQTEQGLLPAARIAQQLGIAHLPPDTVARTRDKLAMRRLLQQTGFSTVACAVVADEADVHAFAAEHGYPVIVKPRRGQGSERVTCVSAPGAVPMAASAPEEEYIVEPFLAGPEFSVEAFSCGGVHHVIALTGKLTTAADSAHPFVEIGHVVPAPVAPDVAAAMSAYVSRFLDVMGITDGCSHTELRMTPSGPEIIETHTRVGGDSIPTLVRQATGHDLLDHAVQWSLNGIRPAQGPIGHPGAAAVRFFTPSPGQVVAITGALRWRGLPGVLTLHLPLAVGDTIGPIMDSRSRAGYVVTTAATADRAAELCEQIIAGVRIEVR